MDDTHQRLLSLIGQLSAGKLVELEQAIRSRLAQLLPSPAQVIQPEPPNFQPVPPQSPTSVAGSVIEVIEATFLKSPECPHCQSKALQKWGSANRLKRYRCKACKVTFNALTGTPLAQLHKRELWGRHSQALADGVSLRKAAGRVGVSLPTAFRWRHRFLMTIKSLKAKKLEGVVEADETYFRYSEKGQRKLARKPRTRGGQASKRGLSDEQVPVLIARDRTKATTDQILADRSEKSVTEVLKPVVAQDAVLVTDGDPAFGAYADKARILHVRLVVSKGEYAYDDYHVQNVNSYTSGLKRWMTRFNGVATKYLDTYLGWNRLNDREGSTLTANSLFVAAMG